VKKLKKTLAGAVMGKVAAVGVQGPKAGEDHDGLTNATLMLFHEFGGAAGRPPERAPMRSTLAEQQAEYQKQLERIGKGVFQGGGTLEGQLLVLGEQYRADMINKMKAGIESKEGVVAHLRETGQLWNSLSVEITEPGKKEAIQ
jgi:hypothetical protein